MKEIVKAYPWERMVIFDDGYYFVADKYLNFKLVTLLHPSIFKLAHQKIYLTCFYSYFRSSQNGEMKLSLDFSFILILDFSGDV